MLLYFIIVNYYNEFARNNSRHCVIKVNIINYSNSYFYKIFFLFFCVFFIFFVVMPKNWIILETIKWQVIYVVVDECNCLQDMSVLHQHHHYNYNLCDDNDVLRMNEHILFLNTNGYLIILFNGEIKSVVLPLFLSLSLLFIILIY